MADIKEVSDRTLRAWADCRVISSARYVDEMQRRRATRETRILTFPDGGTVELFGPDRVHVDAPPLDYELDEELAVPSLAAGDDDEAIPNPAPGAWLVFFCASTVIIAVSLIWRSL
ncbi:hypothetical protein X739_00775 [Mesorhizobium sp. LNHC220B00]|nr:hypothetical protein [Mesorhizobium sp. LNHC220B00]ESY89059.1 hypothetical protein X739_00775 [Mesorhizobium sp. LNHC220B00]